MFEEAIEQAGRTGLAVSFPPPSPGQDSNDKENKEQESVDGVLIPMHGDLRALKGGGPSSLVLYLKKVTTTDTPCILPDSRGYDDWAWLIIDDVKHRFEKNGAVFVAFTSLPLNRIIHATAAKEPDPTQVHREAEPGGQECCLNRGPFGPSEAVNPAGGALGAREQKPAGIKKPALTPQAKESMEDPNGGRARSGKCHDAARGHRVFALPWRHDLPAGAGVANSQRFRLGREWRLPRSTLDECIARARGARLSQAPSRAFRDPKTREFTFRKSPAMHRGCLSSKTYGSF